MITSHLRRNAVAYLALIVALTTGTAYAAGLANGSVTTKKLAKNAVTSPKIKKGAVKSSDLAPGVVPDAGFAFAATELGVTTAGVDAIIDEQLFTLPRPGSVYLRIFIPGLGVTCSSGFPAVAGLFFDEVAVPDTGVQIPNAAGARVLEVVAVVDATAGQHKMSLAVACPNGDEDTVTPVGATTFTALQLSE